MIEKVPFLLGYVNFKSDLKIEEVGRIISKKLLGGLEFIGEDENIYDEVPAVYIDPGIFGLRITLSGYSGINHLKGYILEIRPTMIFKGIKREECRLDGYLTLLLQDALKDIDEVYVIEP